MPSIDLDIAALKAALGRYGHGTAYMNFAEQRTRSVRCSGSIIGIVVAAAVIALVIDGRKRDSAAR